MKYEQRRSDDYLHTNINNWYARQKSVAILQSSVFDNNNN